MLTRLRMLIETLRLGLEDGLAQRDHLTGVMARDRMLDRLGEQADLVERHVHASSVAMLDVDEFKRINDGHGHLVGDEVLVSVARYLLDNLRPFDMVFRYGGDEFLVCAPGADLRVMCRVAERLRRGVARLDQPDHDGGHFRATVSIGVAELEAGLPVLGCVKRADGALYLAKTSGRNRVSTSEGAVHRRRSVT